MLYKEFRAARQKYVPLLLIYIFTGLLVSTILGPSMSFSTDSIFHRWIIGLIFLTMGTAILGGADTIAEETSKNTLSFLLTRPCSRRYIYSIKFLVNAVSLVSVVVLTSLVMFLVEQLPQGYKYAAYTSKGEPMGATYVPLDKMGASQALVDITFILGLGLVVLAITCLVSIFTRNTPEAIVFTVLAIIVPLGMVIFLNGLLNSQALNLVYVSLINAGLGGGAILFGIAMGIYLAGLKVFKAKEF